MNRFNHHKAGFALVEIIISMLLISIASTTLFMMQGQLLKSYQRAAQETQIITTLDQYTVPFLKKAFQAVAEKQTILTVQEKISLPNNAQLQLSFEPIAEQSTLYKKFHENVYWLKVALQMDKVTLQDRILINIPRIHEGAAS